MPNIKQSYDLLQKSLLACKEYWQLEKLFDKIEDFLETVEDRELRYTYRDALWQTFRVMEDEILVKQSKPNTVQHEQ